jgi:hypothetical protein
MTPSTCRPPGTIEKNEKPVYFDQILSLSKGERILKVRTVVRHDEAVHVCIIDRLDVPEHDMAVPVGA